jgi:hypothetical protein
VTLRDIEFLPLIGFAAPKFGDLALFVTRAPVSAIRHAPAHGKQLTPSSARRSTK